MAGDRVVPNNGTTTTFNDTSEAEDVRDLNIYDFMLYTYDGSEGYKDGTYLVPHPRESFYNIRRRVSVYKNLFKPICTAMVDPVYARPITRETGSEMFQKFIEDVDNAGTDAQTFMRSTLTFARLYGVTFVVMDNTVPVAMTIAEAIEKREFPYVYRKDPRSVVEKGPLRWKTDSWGNLISIAFDAGLRQDGDRKTRLYREYTKTEWILYEESGNLLTAIERGTHGLRDENGLPMLPVIAVTNFVNEKTMYNLPYPPLFSLAWHIYSKFQIDSEVRTLSQSQTFSILCVQAGGSSNGLIAGPNNYLDIPMDAKLPPSFIGPDPAHFNNMRDYADKMVDEIFDLAHQNGVIGIRAEASGIAKEWDFRAEENILRQTALAGQSVEDKMAALFEAYTGQSVDYTANYPMEYGPGWESRRMADIMAAMDKMPPPAVQNELWKEFVTLFWKSDEEKAQFIAGAMGEMDMPTDGGAPIREPASSSEEE